MGMKHRDRVFEIPPGFITADERLVLLVLADQTNDDRHEWAHDRAKLLAMIGEDDRWLRRRLKDLEDAGFLIRRKQRKLPDGRWGRGPSIYLANFGWEPWDYYKPTRRASSGTRTGKSAAHPVPKVALTPDPGGQGVSIGDGQGVSGPVGQGVSELVDKVGPTYSGLQEQTRTENRTVDAGSGVESKIAYWKREGFTHSEILKMIHAESA